VAERLDVGCSSHEAARRAGLTYRQLHYLVYRGAVVPARRARGSGNPIRWTPDDVARLVVIGRLSRLLPTRRGISQALASEVWEHLAGPPHTWPACLYAWQDGGAWRVSSRRPDRTHLAVFLAA
jgi:hypothetical protein